MPVEVVTALLLREGTIMMCQRNDKKIYPLHWEFPGGKVEYGETSLQALKREIFEELHLEIHDAEEWFENTMTYSNGITYHVTFFIVRQFRGEPVNTEFNAIDWIVAAKMSTLLHLSGNAQIIEKLMTEGFPT